MDERLKQLLDRYEEIKIGLDEPFKFHCTQCGKCCINREDILLTPYDLYRIAAKLDIMPSEVVETYCEKYIGQDSRIPIVRLKPRGSIKRCPFLKDRKCSIHDAKPGVCATFPIGRCLKVDKNEFDTTGTVPAKIEYIFDNPQCGDNTETHTVREWLESFGIPVDDPRFIRRQQVFLELGKRIRKYEKLYSEGLLDLIWSTIYALIYLKYDTHMDFDEQFEANVAELFELLDKVPTER